MRQRAIMLRARQRISICAGSPNDWGHLWNKRSITQQPRPAIEHTCTMARATSSGFEPVFPAITLEQRPALKPRRGRRVTEGALAPSHGPAEASRRMRVPHSGSRVPELDATHRRPAVRLCERQHDHLSNSVGKCKTPHLRLGAGGARFSRSPSWSGSQRLVSAPSRASSRTEFLIESLVVPDGAGEGRHPTANRDRIRAGLPAIRCW
jgi:hypothetical protein